MNLISIINSVIVILGIPTILGACIYIGKKLQILDDLKVDVERIKEILGGHDKDIQGLKVHTNYGFSNSPTVPNERGLKLLEDSGFNILYPKIKEDVFKKLDEMKTRTLYDIEKNAYKAMRDMSDTTLFDDLKHYVVNHPEVLLNDIIMVGSWIVRSEYSKDKGIER